MVGGGDTWAPPRTAVGNEVVAPFGDAEEDQLMTAAGHPPEPTGAHCTDPGGGAVGRGETVAQFTYAVVWERSVTYGARARLALNPE
jgi:hypothetical protein